MRRVHLVSLPHTQTTRDYLTCAYTMKIVKFCSMMKPLGYEVVLYAGEENEADCYAHIPLISKTECERWFGKHELGRIYPITWDPNDVHWRTMNRRAVRAICDFRASEQDLVLLIAGNCQQEIANGLPDMLACEWGVGYEGIFARACAFESAAWRHYIYGRQGHIDGRWYDAVIHNFFNPDDFYTAPKDDYLLYIGRCIMRKGPHVAAEIAKRVGLPLVGAGRSVSAPRCDSGDHPDANGMLSRRAIRLTCSAVRPVLT